MTPTRTQTTRTRARAATLATLLIFSTPTPTFASDCDAESQIASEAIENAEAAAELTKSCKLEAGELRTQRDEYRAAERASIVNEAIATGRLFEVRELEASASARAVELERINATLEDTVERERSRGVVLTVALVAVTIVAGGSLALALSR